MPPSTPSIIVKLKRGRGRPPGTKNNPKRPSLAPPCNSGTMDMSATGNAVEPVTPGMASLNRPAIIISAASASTMGVGGNTANTAKQSCSGEGSKQNGVEEVGTGLDKCPVINANLTQNTTYSGTRARVVYRLVNPDIQIAQIPPEAEQNHQPVNPVKVVTAEEFIADVQRLTANQPHLFKLFKDLLDKYFLKQIDDATLLTEVATHFSAYPEIVTQFEELAMDEVDLNGPLVVSLGADLKRTKKYGYRKNTANMLVKGSVAGCPENDQCLIHKTNTPRSDAKNHEKFPPQQGVKFLRPVDVYGAQSLGDMTLVSINFHEVLQTRLINDPQKYNIVSSALSAVHEMNQNLLSSTDAHVPLEPSVQRMQAYNVIRENLREEPDLLELFNAFYTSEKNFLGLPSGAAAKDNIYELEKKTEVSKPEGLVQISSAAKQAISTPTLVTLGSRPMESKVFKDVLSAVLEEQEICLGFQITDPSISKEEKLRRILQIQYDEGKWITELVYALSPILLRITSLRTFIINNLGITLFKHDKICDESGPSGEDPSSDKKSDPVEFDQRTENFPGGSYHIHPDESALAKCSGRTDLCNEVLNDKYFSVSSHKKFRQNMRTKEEQRLDDYEDARYEVDMLLNRGVRTIDVLEESKQKMRDMTQMELNNFQLDDNLGGSSVLHKRVIQLLYKDDGKHVLKWLQEFPSLFIPGVLKILKVRDKEWIELRARWNAVISADVKRFKDMCNRKRRMHYFSYTYVPERTLNSRRELNK